LAESHMSLNPGTQNIENLGNSAKTLRLIFQALDVNKSAHDSIGKTSLFRPRPRFTQSQSPTHHPNSSKFSTIGATYSTLPTPTVPTRYSDARRTDTWPSRAPLIVPPTMRIDFHSWYPNLQTPETLPR